VVKNELGKKIEDLAGTTNQRFTQKSE